MTAAAAPLRFGYGHSVPLVGATPLGQVTEARLGPLGLAALGRLQEETTVLDTDVDAPAVPVPAGAPR